MSATNTTKKPALKPAVLAQAKKETVAAAKPKAAVPVAKALEKPAAKPAAKVASKTATAKPLAVKAKSAANGKSAVVAKPEPVAKTQVKPSAGVTVEKEKAKKIKLIRDSFTMPEAEYAVLGQVKKSCLKAGVEIKKSELLRVGVALISGLEVASLKAVLATLPQLKSGRPGKEK